MRHRQENDSVQTIADGAGRHGDLAIGVHAIVAALVQIANKLADIEPAGGVADQDDLIARQNFAASDALSQVSAQSGGAGGYGGGRQVVEVMEHDGSAGAPLPGLEQAGDAGVVLDTAEGVEAAEAGYQYDVTALAGEGHGRTSFTVAGCLSVTSSARRGDEGNDKQELNG
jgi:hypothetical protein